MKNIKKHKKILMAIAAILSPVMYAAIFMFLPRINYAEGMLHIDNGDPGDMDKILSYSISHASLLIPAVLAIIVLVVNMTIAGYLVAKGTNKIEKRFGYLTVIAGGLGLNTLYLAFKLFKKDTTEVKRKGRFLFGATTIAVPLTLVPMFGLAFYKGVDKPTTVGDVKFSTVETKPNVIEIFTDGFDPRMMKPRLENDNHLNGFTMYDHFVTSGAETSFSFPTMMGGIEDFNIFKQKDMGASGNMEDLYSSIFANSVVKHMMVDKGTDGVDRDRYFVNTNSMGKSASFQESSSGHPEGITDANTEYNNDAANKGKAQADLQPVNFGQVKNTVTGTFGSANYAPEVMNYQFLAKKAKVDNSMDHGSRYMMQEFVTHPPRLVGKDGSLVLSMGAPSIPRAEDGLKTSLDSTMDMLKGLQGDNGRSVYDNSMIIIYGDHANHVNPLVHNPYNPRTPETTNAEKWHSFAMIKYPNTSGNLNGQQIADANGKPVSHPVNNPQIFYAPFMNKVIGSFYENPDKRDFISGDKTHFPDKVSTSRRLLGFFGDESMYMHFEDVNGWPTLMPDDDGWVLYDKPDKAGTYSYGIQKSLVTGTEAAKTAKKVTMYSTLGTDSDSRQAALLDKVVW